MLVKQIKNVNNLDITFQNLSEYFRRETKTVARNWKHVFFYETLN